MNVTGLIGRRSAEAKAWFPLVPHFRAELSRVESVLRPMLPVIFAIVDAGWMNSSCVACNLLARGLSTRNQKSSRQHGEIRSLLLRAQGKTSTRLCWLALMLGHVRSAAGATTATAGGAL